MHRFTKGVILSLVVTVVFFYPVSGLAIIGIDELGQEREEREYRPPVHTEKQHQPEHKKSVSNEEISIKATRLGFYSTEWSSSHGDKSSFQERTLPFGLAVKVTLNNESESRQTGNLDVKVWGPDGLILQGRNAPAGISGRSEAQLNPRAKNWIFSISVFNNSFHSIGQYRAEVFWEGSRIAEGVFSVVPQHDPLSAFSNAYDFHDGLAIVRLRKMQKSVVINAQGSIIALPTFDYIGNTLVSEGMISVANRGKWGFIDRFGKVSVPPIYDIVRPFSEEMAAVKVNGYWGFVDKTGNMAIRPLYYDVGKFSNGLARVSVGGKWGFVDKVGSLVVPLLYDYVWDFQDGWARVRIGTVYNYVSRENRLISPNGFRQAKDFSEGMAGVLPLESNKRWGYINSRGHEVMTGFGYVESFSEGIACVAMFDPSSRSFTRRFIDKEGITVITLNPYIPFSRQGSFGFKEGLATVVDPDTEKVGYMDKTGRMVISPRFAVAYPFSNGLARVALFDGCGFVYIDKSGNIQISDAN